jgi:hypothetical protein
MTLSPFLKKILIMFIKTFNFPMVTKGAIIGENCQTEDKIMDKKEMRKKIAQDTEQYLKNGGKINKVKYRKRKSERFN